VVTGGGTVRVGLVKDWVSVRVCGVSGMKRHGV
jgi:hypothetical protein